MQPLVSIVMPSLNQAAFLPLAVQSVLSQSYPHLELIVADGGSVDGSLDWLAQRQAGDARLRWACGSDCGPADAINKALRLSRGTLIGWLNSDDLYTPGAVQRAVQSLLTHRDWLMVYGHGEHVDAGGDVLEPYPTLAPPVRLQQFASGCFICQPTVFFRRSMWLLLGPLDQTLQTAFDFDYWLRAFSAFPDRAGFVDALQAQSRLHPGCITRRLRRTAILEGMQLLARYLGHAPKEWFLTYAIELLALPPDERGVTDVKAHLAQMLEQARPWLRVSDFAALKLKNETF